MKEKTKMGMKTRKPRKLRSRTWTMEGYNHKEALAVTALDLVGSLRMVPSGKTLEWTAEFCKKPEDLGGEPAVKQRITVTVEDIAT